MAKITSNCLNLNEERILEMIDRSQHVKYVLNNILYRNIRYIPDYNAYAKIDKINSIHKKAYQEDLSKEELTVLALYVLIYDDNKFALEFIRTKGNFDYIRKIYDVPKEFVLLRWKLRRKIVSYEQNIKKLSKEL